MNTEYGCNALSDMHNHVKGNKKEGNLNNNPTYYYFF